MGKRRRRLGKKHTVVEKREAKDPVVNADSDNSVVFGMDERAKFYAGADEYNKRVADIEDDVELNDTTGEIAPTADVDTETVDDEKIGGYIDPPEDQDEKKVEEINTETAPAVVEPDASTVKEEYVTETVEEGAVVDTPVLTPIDDVAPTEKIKTVPHGAFHEERERRKAADLRVKELENKLANKVPEGTVEMTDDFVDPDVKALKERLDKYEARDEQREVDSEKRKTEADIETVHQRLLLQGIGGFNTIGRKIVNSTLNELFVTDPDFAIAHNNPEGWVKIYLEALPELQAIGRKAHKSTLVSEKVEAKKGANLITTQGKKFADDTNSKSKLTPKEAYVAERSQNQL